MSSSGDRVIVKADPDIAELIPGYLENRKKDLFKLREAVENGDYKTIEYLGHSMKGSGDGYGFSGISAIGNMLERAARVHDKEAVLRGIVELLGYMERIEVIYE